MIVDSHRAEPLPVSDSKPIALEISGDLLPTGRKPLKDKRILVVEDDADSRERHSRTKTTEKFASM